MSRMDELASAPWGAAPTPVIRPVMMARGTLLSLDFAKTRRLAEEVLGFVCVEVAPDRMLLRHRTEKPGGRYWVLEVRRADANPSPQRMSNHWGIWVPETEDVDAAYALLSANMDKYGILRVHKPRYAHQGRRDYSMYFEDTSGNWWEIDRHPEEEEFITFFNSGDWDSHQ